MKWTTLFLLFFTLELQAEPIGSYTDGRLTNAQALPAEGEGYMQLYRSVGHVWSTPEMLEMIVKTALHMKNLYPGRDRLQVEELSAKEGGDIESHSSHENGLDGDLQYFKKDGAEHDPVKSKSYYAKPMVNGSSVDANFDVERNWELVKALHQFGDVQKIFMDQVLKAKLCDHARSLKELNSHLKVLRSIRHVENHQDHLHVRLRCPPRAKRCKPLPEPPAGSGC